MLQTLLDSGLQYKNLHPAHWYFVASLSATDISLNLVAKSMVLYIVLSSRT